MGFAAGDVSLYAYVEGNPLQRTDHFGLACDQRGCWNTPSEAGAAAADNWRLYYDLACAGGDPYACRAGEVASDTGEGFRGMLSEVTNRKLEISIATHQSTICPIEARVEDLAAKMDAIRRGLMHARVAQLFDATEKSPRQVDRREIAQFHHSVFSDNGAGPDAFGGDLWDLIRVGRPFYDWCEAPACKH